MGSEPHKILHIETEFLVWFVVIVELRANTLMAFLWSSHMTDKSQLKKKRAVGPGECVCRRYEFSVGTGPDIYIILGHIRTYFCFNPLFTE